MIPGVAAYVYFGTALSSLTSAVMGDFDGGWVQLILLIVGVVVAVVAIVLVTWRAKVAIQKVLSKSKSQENLEFSRNRLHEHNPQASVDEENQYQQDQ